MFFRVLCVRINLDILPIEYRAALPEAGVPRELGGGSRSLALANALVSVPVGHPPRAEA